MRSARFAYTETTTSPTNIIVGATIVIALGVIALLTHRWAAYGIAAAIVAAICWQLSVVQLSIGNGVLSAKQGPLVSYRVPLAKVMHPEILQLRLSQVLGFAAPLRWRMTKMCIRPGTTLRFTVDGGSTVLISIRRPDTVLEILASQQQLATKQKDK